MTVDQRRTPIKYTEFLAIAERCCTTLSRRARPALDEAAYRYESRFADFLNSNVYPVWFVNGARTTFVNYDDPAARAIKLSDLAGLPNLVGPHLEIWYKPALGPVTTACFIALHCAGCGRRVLIDGVHRAVWLAVNVKADARVKVTELSGSRWPPGTPDLNVVCACGTFAESRAAAT